VLVFKFSAGKSSVAVEVASLLAMLADLRKHRGANLLEECYDD
jgi:hypothetical protein